MEADHPPTQRVSSGHLCARLCGSTSDMDMKKRRQCSWNFCAGQGMISVGKQLPTRGEGEG